MNVAIVISRLSNGGLERVQSHLAHAFAQRGIHTAVAAGVIVHRHAGDFPPEVPVVEIASAGRLAFAPGLLNFLRRTRPDCVFTTSNDVACMAVAMKRLFFPQLRVVVTQHLSLSGPLGHSSGWQQTKLRIVRAIMRLLLRHADAFVAVTNQVANDLADEIGLDRRRIHVIHNPIIGSDFASRLDERPPVYLWGAGETPTIVYAGRLAPEKRLDLLLDAFSELLTRRQARLLIVGDGPERTALEQRICLAPLSGRCMISGFVDNVFPLIAASDVLVLPSDYEGFGNVLVEAMACGVQVVATDCPHGPREILEDGHYGQLVPTGDAAALREAIERVLTGEARIEPELLRTRARQFGVDRAADEYVSLMRDVIAAPAG